MVLFLELIWSWSGWISNTVEVVTSRTDFSDIFLLEYMLSDILNIFCVFLDFLDFWQLKINCATANTSSVLVANFWRRKMMPPLPTWQGPDWSVVCTAKETDNWHNTRWTDGGAEAKMTSDFRLDQWMGELRRQLTRNMENQEVYLKITWISLSN